MMISRLKPKNYDTRKDRPYPMYNLILAVIAGILACVTYWADHTMVRAESDTIQTETYWKLFAGGVAISYITSLCMSSDSGQDILTNSVSKDAISEIVDTIKTGQPSF